MFRGSDIPRLFAVAGLLALAACSDATAPAASVLPEAPVPPGLRAAVHVQHIERTDDSVVVDFTVTPSGGWFYIGYNAVYFPAHSICEPSSSGYGPATWDLPCSPAKGPVRIRARAGRGLNDRGWMHFDTDLRFVPSTRPQQWVRIYMYSALLRIPKPANADERERAYNIYWVPTSGAAPVDESVDDRTLKTQVMWGTGLVTRRVKHFSGYQVGEGFVEQESMLER